jgi:hypothetical protein
MTSSSTITLQRATADQDAILRTLSALDSARPVRRPALLAIVDGRAVAAASLADGRIVADPFTDSAEAAALLRIQADASSASASAPLGGWRRPRPRLRPRLRIAI